jgi:DNA-binding transcriptional ArsR family regulator
MEPEDHFSNVAALIGDKCRSVMLWNLLDGRAYTATELSLCADVTAQSASNHLSKLVDANILIAEKQGRHRYYRYANDDVAHVIESMASLLTADKKITKQIFEPSGITYARSCYDHIAGKFGVTLTDSLLKKEIIFPTEKKYAVSNTGKKWFKSAGINIEEIQLHKRSFAYPCLDWSERKYHVAGALGAALLQMMIKEAWIRKSKHSREIFITPKGKLELNKRLSLDL